MTSLDACAELRDRLRAGECPEASGLDKEIVAVLAKVAKTASDEEWDEFAQSGFDLAAMPPILLSRSDMELVRGGQLPSAADVLGFLRR